MVATASGQTGSIPLPRTRLIGREHELALARTFLLDEAVPLLALTGPGGVGKTRLAQAICADVAGAFADGVVWVDLAPLADVELVAVAVTSACGITPRPNQPILAELTEHLRRQQLLLVLDNCEHLLDAVAGLVSTVLAACPALQVMAASRAPLRVRGEQVLPVEPLPLPQMTGSPGASIAENDAMRLFMDRARAVRPGFTLTATNAATLAALCHALDGLPLAIELAAARITMLSPDTLLAQMTDRLVLLSDGPRDAPVRHQTIAATIGWSFDLLTDEARALIQNLAVFAGGFTLAAARAVADVGDASFPSIMRGINALVEQSLIHRIEGDGEPRFTMLETIRAFALERLRESGEDRRTRDRHAAWFIELVASREAWVAAFLPDGPAILDDLETDYANLHAALTWLRETENVSGVLALASDLLYLWELRGHLREGRQWLEWGLARAATCDPLLQAHAQWALSSLYQAQRQAALAFDLIEASVQHFRACGDQERIAHAAAHAAWVALDVAERGLAESYIAEALAAFNTLAGVPWAASARSNLQRLPGIMAKGQGDLPRAERLLGEVVAEQRRIAEEGGEQPYRGRTILAWASVAHHTRELPIALERYQAALEHALRFQDALIIAYVVTRVASILAMRGRWSEAAWMLGSAEAFADRSGLTFHQNIWAMSRAFGVPQPWQGPEEYMGMALAVRRVTLQYWPDPLPPLPDPDAAAALWASGRHVPIEEAVAYTLAVGLDTVPPPSPLLAAPLAAGAQLAALTPRQREILALLCHRLTDPEIAARLYLSPRTVEGHVTQILSKLGVATRREAAAVATRLSLV